MKDKFNDYGIELSVRDGRYFIRYDAGEIVDKIEEIEVSEEDARRAQISENDAYNVILKYQNRSRRL